MYNIEDNEIVWNQDADTSKELRRERYRGTVNRKLLKLIYH